MRSKPRLKTIKPRLETLRAAPVRTLITKAGASERVRGSAWARIRNQVLVRDAYICQGCGRVSADNEVDHIKPLEQGGHPTALSNLQTLCKGPDGCHTKKTAREAGMRSGRIDSQQ